jgi:hypothetical protein
MAVIANSLGVAASTVYRALIRLAAIGLVSYDVKRGRSGGVAFVHLTPKDLKDRATAAWEYIKAAKQRAAERWIERLRRSGYPFAEYEKRYALRSSLVRAQRKAFYGVGSIPWTAADMASLDAEAV